MSSQTFILDGTNIVLFHGRARPRLTYLLAICEFLQARSAGFHCVFDANIRHIFKDVSAAALTEYDVVVSEGVLADRYELAPSGVQADERILALAKRRVAHVVSNDKFRDRARKNRWIWKRRHSFLIAGDCVLIPSLNARIACAPPQWQGAEQP